MSARLFLIAAAASAGALCWHLADWRGIELREIRLSDGLDAATVKEVRAATSGLGGSILKIDLEDVKRRVESIPAVRAAEVRRSLPDRLDVDVEIRRPLARWAPGGLVDIHGEIYSGTPKDWLPIFDGSSSRLAEMAEYYFFARNILGSLPAGMGVVQLHLSDAGEWRAFLNNGWVLKLGSRDIHSRLKRFVDAHAGIAGRFAEVAYVDLRYPSGLAVKGEGAATESNQKEKQ